MEKIINFNFMKSYVALQRGKYFFTPLSLDLELGGFHWFNLEFMLWPFGSVLIVFKALIHAQVETKMINTLQELSLSYFLLSMCV